MNLARQGDQISGNAPGEHHGHYHCDRYSCYPVHTGSNPLGGTITTASNNVFCNGMPVARIGDSTQEWDSCGPGTGSVASGSSTVFCNGIPVARVGDRISPHHGYANISSGSPNVFVGG